VKITFLLPHCGSGGGVRAVVRFAVELAHRGHTTRIMYRAPRRGPYSMAQRAWLTLRYGVSADWMNTFSGKSQTYRTLCAEGFAPDEVVIAMCAQTTFDAASLPDGVGIKMLHCHGIEPENWDAMVRSWELPMPKLAISHRVASIIRQVTGQPVVGVVPDGVDLSEYFDTVPVNQRLGVGTSYRRSFAKDPETTLAVLRALHVRLPQAPFFVFSPERRPRLPSRRVHYVRLPRVPVMRQMYNSSRVWYLASRCEGFGMTILEAMACGCAVVATDCGGPADLIEDGHNGLLVKVGDTPGLVNSIGRLFQDERLCKKIAVNGQRTAAAFSWSAAGSKLESELSKIWCSVSLPVCRHATEIGDIH